MIQRLIPTRTLASITAVALLLAGVAPVRARAEPGAVVPPLPGMAASEQMAFDQQARAILEGLRVNDAGAASAVRERPTRLVPGTPELMAVPIGGARTITLSGPYDTVVVASPDIVQVVPLTTTRVQLVARAAGSTDVVFTAGTGETWKARVTVAVNALPVQSAISAALPGERITATAVNGSLVLTGTTRDAVAANTAMNIARRFVADQINGVVNDIRVLGGQQVMLRVRVAEVSRNVIKQLGLNTAVGTSAGGVGGNAPGLSAFGRGGAPTGISGTNPANLANPTNGLAPLLALGGAANPVAFISSRALGTVFTSVASALESEGLVRTLAEPNLVTQSGKTANMLAGAQYPVPSISQSGRLGTEYRNFGVSLAFTPTVVSATAIGLDIATEVSTRAENVAFPDGAGGTFNIPVFNTRRATTTVELPSGGSIVIAGLVSSDFQNTMSGLPGIKDVPILGKLFGSVDFQRHETELVISVTAYLVEPTDSAQIASPTDGMVAPSDVDLYVLNRLTGNASRALARAPAGVERNFGYITERE